MQSALKWLSARIPERMRVAFAIGLALMLFLVVDQSHWWRMKPDYAFGWLVPLFVIYIFADRWAQLQQLMWADAPRPLRRWQRIACDMAVAVVLMLGAVLFLLGAFYRGGAGESQPGSLALAFGFAGLFLGLIYFNVPASGLTSSPLLAGWPKIQSDARLRALALLFFPAFIWILSAPLVTAIENAISLFLLRRVVSVVFTVFNFLGYSLVQEGNVLVLPQGRVGVAEACSGIRSLTGCLFAGSFLAAVFLPKFWQKISLIIAAAGLAVLTNLFRSLFLTAWAYAYGSQAIEGALHDVTGFAVLGLTVIGLLCLIPLIRGSLWNRWMAVDQPEEFHWEGDVNRHNPVAESEHPSSQPARH